MFEISSSHAIVHPRTMVTVYVYIYMNRLFGWVSFGMPVRQVSPGTYSMDDIHRLQIRQ
jgi:hypothetical protein